MRQVKMITYGLFSNQQMHQTQDFGCYHFNISSANISLWWHIIQCTRIVKIYTLRISKIRTVEIPRGELLDFWNGAANVFIWSLKFGEGEIIWDLKLQGPICTICGLKFGVGEII